MYEPYATIAVAPGVPYPTHAVTRSPTTIQQPCNGRNRGPRSHQQRAVFDSEEQMEQMMTMGMPEGLQEAVAQIDDLLAD